MLLGVATVGVLHATVRRHFGSGAGLFAGALLALTPVAALMFRFDNPDALLVCMMTLAVWAALRAVDASSAPGAGGLRWYLLTGVFLGVGFLTKTLQVFLVIPAIALVWLVAARPAFLRRLRYAALGAAAMLLLSLIHI